MLIQHRLQSHGHDAIKSIAPAAVRRLPTRLRLDFIARYGLLTVHALTYAAVHSRQIWIFAARPMPFDYSLRMESDLAAA
jgi:hypothetical protein